MNKKIAMVSGGFDPLHKNHVSMILEAATFGDVVVVLNTDEWLLKKKGYFFMDFESRKKILESIKGVIKVVKAKDDDSTVCKNIEDIKPDYFCNGGDRKIDSTPELEICKKLGIEMKWGIGGTKKDESSSWLIERVVEKVNYIKNQGA